MRKGRRGQWAKDKVKGGTRKQGKLLRGPACSSVEEVVDGQV